MIKIKITENEDEQRLDRFLRKYLKKATLSYIYKLIRTSVKLNGKKVKEDVMLRNGDELTLYISEDELENFRRKKEERIAKKQFGIAYEDEKVIVVEKPFGLLTHGDANEKKNHLANQVISYLIEKGEYNPAKERSFVPSPVNRLDRNTSGLVIFGKTAHSLKDLNFMLRERGYIDKYYLTVVHGKLSDKLELVDRMKKDAGKNTVKIVDDEEGKLMETVVFPLEYSRGYTLCQVKLVTGRTHQIRAHLARAGFPVLGDGKYGSRQDKERTFAKFKLSTQFLHAFRLEFIKGYGELEYLEGKIVECGLTDRLLKIKSEIFERKK